MDERDIGVVRKLKSLISKRVQVYELRVFGSRAGEEATAESDLDVLIVVKEVDRET